MTVEYRHEAFECKHVADHGRILRGSVAASRESSVVTKSESHGLKTLPFCGQLASLALDLA